MKTNELIKKLNQIDDVYAYINNGEIILEDSSTKEYYLHFSKDDTTWPEVLLENVRKPDGDYVAGFSDSGINFTDDLANAYNLNTMKALTQKFPDAIYALHNNGGLETIDVKE